MDIVVVGSCFTDLISYTERLPKPGETVLGSKFVMGFGGKGANQCVMAGRLGAKVAMVAKIGDDDFGRKYVENFKDNNVNIDHVTVDSDASTGAAQIFVNSSGENSIVITGAASLKLEQEDILKAVNAFEGAKVVVCQLEIKADTSLFALKQAKKYGAMTVFNPAPAQENLHPEFFTSSDIFCANETEAEMLTGVQIRSIDEAKEAAKILLDRGCNTVILTLGDKGSVFACKDRTTPQHVPVCAVKAVDTTGAGDAFIGALAFFLACHQELPLEEMISRSGAIAARSVQLPGTQTSFPRRSELPQDLFK